MQLEIEYLPTEELVPYEDNARIHGPESVAGIANSIKAFGFDDPIGIWKGNIVIEGNGRLEAAKQLGLKTVPVVRLDHLTDEQRRAYALAHNKVAELSRWDEDLLKAELEAVEEFDMADFGFVKKVDETDYSELFEDAGEPKEKEPKTAICPHCGAVVEV